jgi:hypothetical protein
MEVIVSLAIFVLAFLALHAMVNMSGERAIDIQEKSETAHRCQSIMAEVMSGVVALQSQSEQAFDDNPDYSWSMDCTQQGTVANLWTVTVHVTRTRKDGNNLETSLTQMIVDPSIRGSTFDTVSISSSSSSGSGSQGGSSSSGGTSTPASGGTTTPAGGAGGGAAKGGTTTPGAGAGKGTTTPAMGTGKGTTTPPATGTGKGTTPATGTGKGGASTPAPKGG